MPGDLFLEAARRGGQLKKGFPTKFHGTVPERDLDRLISDDPMYRISDRLDKAVNRLRESSPYDAVEERLTTEKAEGMERNKPDVTKIALPRPKKD